MKGVFPPGPRFQQNEMNKRDLDLNTNDSLKTKKITLREVFEDKPLPGWCCIKKGIGDFLLDSARGVLKHP